MIDKKTKLVIVILIKQFNTKLAKILKNFIIKLRLKIIFYQNHINNKLVIKQKD